MSAKHIIFDWNSTLLDDFHIIHECMNLILQRVGRPTVTMEQFRASYEVPFEQLYMNLGFSKTEADNMMVLERGVFHDFYEPLAANAGLREGATDILRLTKANGIHNYILSNHIVDPIRNQLRRLSIDHYFTEVLAYADRATQFVNMTKGDKLRHYMAEKEITGHQGLIIGDSVEEIQIGKAQSLITVAITGGGAQEKHLHAEMPDYIIHSLSELKPILHERGFVA